MSSMHRVAPEIACAAWLVLDAGCAVEGSISAPEVQRDDARADTRDGGGPAPDDRDALAETDGAATTPTSDASVTRACDEHEWTWQGKEAYPADASFDTPFDCGAAGTLAHHGGPPENRVNLVVLGDGYRAEELQSAFAEHAARLVAHMFSPEGEPYRSYARYLNVCRLDVPSEDSGTDIPDEGVVVDTAFDGNGSDRTRLGLVDGAKVNAAVDTLLEGTRIQPHWVAVSLNVNRWFNSGGAIMVWAGARPGPPDVALHEAGHSFHGLADEYGGSPGTVYDGPEPPELNVTTDPTGARWARWLGYEQPGVGRIGAYEGGRYHDRGIYRPSPNSKMNQVPALHNAPAMEKIVLDIHRFVRPIDAWTSNDRELVNPCALELVLVDPERVEVAWQVDGVAVTSAEEARLEVPDVLRQGGSHTITARAYDPTPLVRAERDALEQTITWRVRIDAR